MTKANSLVNATSSESNGKCMMQWWKSFHPWFLFHSVLHIRSSMDLDIQVDCSMPTFGCIIATCIVKSLYDYSRDCQCLKAFQYNWTMQPSKDAVFWSVCFLKDFKKVKLLHQWIMLSSWTEKYRTSYQCQQKVPDLILTLKTFAFITKEPGLVYMNGV